MDAGGALTWLHLTLVHLLPWAGGFVLSRFLLGLRGQGALALHLGIGGAVGMPLAAAGLWLVSAAGVPMTMPVALIATLLVGVALATPLWLVGRKLGGAELSSVVAKRSEQLDAQRLSRILIVVIAALVLLRFVSLLPDVTQRPLFPWDAWKTWAWKARVWFENRELLPFLSSGHWETAGADRYVIDGVDHPDFISLVFLWSALALGEWNDRLIGLAWLFAGIWSCLMTWGVLRFAGLPRVLSWLGCYLLISLPMVASHIALFGYADIWVMLYLQVFSVGLVLWARRPCWQFGLLMLTAAGMMVLTKDTGGYWLPALAMGVIATRLSDRLLSWSAAVAILLLGVVVWQGFDPMAWLSAGRYTLNLQPLGEVLPAIARHMFVWLDWHLLWFLVPLAFVGAFRFGLHNPQLRAVLWLCVLLLGTVFAGFLATRAGQYAVIGTLFSRVLLQAAPAFILLIVMVGWEWAGHAASDKTLGPEHP